jgi:cytochrome c
MRKLLFQMSLILCFLASCGTESKKDTKIPVKEKIAVTLDGKKIFNDNGCTACHQEQKKIIGPAVRTISQVYQGKSSELIGFLKGENKAIVVEDAGQIAMMQANISLTKNMSEEVLKALSDYILSVE